METEQRGGLERDLFILLLLFLKERKKEKLNKS